MLSAALDSALGGQGQLVLIAGEAGIGKTRIAEELCADARAREARVVWGRCHEGEGAPAYWPWRQALRAYAAGRQPGLPVEFGEAMVELAELVPELVGAQGRWTSPACEQPPVDVAAGHAGDRLSWPGRRGPGVPAVPAAPALRQPYVLVSRLPLVSPGSVSHYLGLLATTMSRWEDAASHFEAATRVHERMDALPLLARSRYHYAEALVGRGRPDDLRRAEEHLASATAIARQLGMPRLAAGASGSEGWIPPTVPTLRTGP